MVRLSNTRGRSGDQLNCSPSIRSVVLAGSATGLTGSSGPAFERAASKTRAAAAAALPANAPARGRPAETSNAATSRNTAPAVNTGRSAAPRSISRMAAWAQRKPAAWSQRGAAHRLTLGRADGRVPRVDLRQDARFGAEDPDVTQARQRIQHVNAQRRAGRRHGAAGHPAGAGSHPGHDECGRHEQRGCGEPADPSVRAEADEGDEKQGNQQRSDAER